MHKKITAAYVRVSTEEQCEEGFSLEAQIEKCALQAKLKGLSKPRVYSDPGISGCGVFRPGYQSLIDDCKAGIISHIIVWRIDRLTRHLKQLMDLIDMTIEFDIELISLTESFDTGTPSGRLCMRTLGSFNEYFLEMQSENITSGLQKRNSLGKWSTCAPTGGAVVEGRLVWTDQAKQVSRAFEMAAHGCQIGEISEETGIERSTLYGVLANPVYCGKLRTKYGVFDGEHEAIISEELFEQVQKVRRPSNERRPRKTSHPLTGFVRCGMCGRSMSIIYNGKSLLSYRCQHRRGQSCEGVGTRSANKIERAFMASLELLKEHHDFQKELRDFWGTRMAPSELSEQIASVEREIARIETKRKKIAVLLL